MLRTNANAATIRTAYAADFARGEDAGWQRMFGDYRYLLAARTLGDALAARGVDSWLYYVDFVPASQTEWLGTPHGVDAWFLFNGHNAPDAQVRQLNGQLRGYWLNFARNGDPNGPELPRWPRYESDARPWLRFAAQTRSVPDPIGAKLAPLIEHYRERTAAAAP